MKSSRVYIVGTDSAVASIFFDQGYMLTTSRPTTADIIVFTGGVDINPKLYNEKPLPKTRMSVHRDNEDLKVWDLVKNDKDIFKVGICRGGQLLNVLCDGSMYQHVNNHALSYRNTHKATNLLKIPGTVFNVGTQLNLSSVHHQMMIPSNKGEVLCYSNEATEYLSPDNKKPPEYEPEVIYYPDERCFCFQPHPEVQKAYQTRSYFFALIDLLRDI